MTPLTKRQEQIYTELLLQQLKAESRFEVFTDDDDFFQCIKLDELNLVTILVVGKTALVRLNRDNVKFELAPNFVK